MSTAAANTKETPSARWVFTPRRARRIAFALVALSLAVAALSSACGGMMDDGMGPGMMEGMMGDGSDPSEEAAVEGATDVRQQDFAFAPANIVVDAGTTVTWTNYDAVGHTVTSDDGGELESPLLGQNETFSHTFDEPGDYLYYCQPHPNMRGLVTVRPQG